MGDGGKGDYISPSGPPVSVSDIPDLIPTNLTDFGDSESSEEPSSEPSSSTSGVVGSGIGVGVGSGSGTSGGDPDEPKDDDEKLRGPDASDREGETSESDKGNEDSDENEEERDEQEDDDHQVMIVFQSDAWDNIGWGLYPVRLRIQEEYGSQVGIHEDLVSVREFDNPSGMKEKWRCDSKRHKMPVDTSVWIGDPPGSTQLSIRAYAAARHQGLNIAADYLRRLRVAAIVEGTNIEDEEVLFKHAEEVGLDTTKLKEDWAMTEVKTSSSSPQTPKTFVHTDNKTMEYDGYVHIDDLKMICEQAGLDEQEPQSISEFVREHGPLATHEVMFVYGFESKEQTRMELQDTNGVMPVRYGTTTFWATAA